jgi:hypothetical protein
MVMMIQLILLIKVNVPIAAILAMTTIVAPKIMAPFIKYRLPLLASHARFIHHLEKNIKNIKKKNKIIFLIT